MAFAYGQILSAVGSTVNAIGAKATAEMNADQLRVQRYMTYISSGFVDMANTFNKKSIEKQKQAMVGTQQAVIARSGITFDGSPTEVVLDTIAEYEKEKISSDISAAIDKLNLKVEGKQLESQEKQTRKAGTLSLIGGLLQAGSSMGGK